LIDARFSPITGAATADDAMPPMRKWTINGDFLTLSPNGVARYGR